MFPPKKFGPAPSANSTAGPRTEQTGRVKMTEFDFPRLIAYYRKVLTGCLKFGGNDWRYETYQERLNRIIDLSEKSELSRDECEYLEARSAVAAAF